jgi:hypothetical protein
MKTLFEAKNGNRAYRLQHADFWAIMTGGHIYYVCGHTILEHIDGIKPYVVGAKHIKEDIRTLMS